MKVLLTAINSQYIHSNLAVRYLKAYTRDLEYECKINEFTINDRIENIMHKILEQKPNVVVFSCYIWNIEYVKKLATLLKIVDERIIIIFGGPEVTYDGYGFLKENSGDYVTIGEGEETYRELIKYIIEHDKNNDNEMSLSKIKGIYYRNKSDIKFTGFRGEMEIDNVIFPYDNEDDLNNKIVYYEASRGCPFNCKYCLSSTIHNVRFRNIETVKKELEFLVNKEVRLIKFVDRTFNCNPKFAIEIWDYLSGLDTDTKFHFEISADILTKEQVEVLTKAPHDRFQFEVGVQTTNNTILNNINRNVNFSDIIEKVQEVQKLGGIKQHLDLIAGLPGESYDSFVNSFNDLYSLRPEEIQLGFLKLLKGTDMRKEADIWEMKFSPYPPYEILKTKHITYDELVILKRVEKVVDKYYNSQKFNNIILYFEDKFKIPFEFYKSLADFCKEKGYFDRNLASNEYYKVFLEFNKEVLNENNDVLREIIKFEYLMNNKKKWIPDFLDRDLDKKQSKIILNYLKENKPEYISDRFHVEKFKININKYLINKEILFENYYILFDELSNTSKYYDLRQIVDIEKIF